MNLILILIFIAAWTAFHIWDCDKWCAQCTPEQIVAAIIAGAST